MEYTKALATLIEEFQKLPGIGPKSAQRMAFFVLRRSNEQVGKFIHAVQDAKENIKYCGSCFNLTTHSECEICSNPKRDKNQLCILPEVKDLVALERTKEYTGFYHVLGGVISPLDGISADDLNISSLIERIKKLSEEDIVSSANPLELILAISPSTEGEATILYIKRLIKESLAESSNLITVTRLAYGLPVGADLDYIDEMTLARALEARQLC